MTRALAILNHNGINLLKLFLKENIRNTPDTKIYLIDNNSSDDSIKFVQGSFPEVTIIQIKKNLGYSGGYNESMKYIDEDLIFLLNNDAVFLDKKSFLDIIEVFEKNEKVSVAQPSIVNFNNKEKYEYAGASGGFIDFFGYPFCRGRVIKQIENCDVYNTTREVFWASGCCFAVRNKIFKKLNGFDNDFFTHMEEIDFCWRLKNINNEYKVISVGKSKVYHIGASTLNYNSSKKYFFNFRNSLIMIVKNIPLKYLTPVIFSRIFIDLFIAIICFLKFKPKLSYSIFNAYYYLFSNLRIIFAKRYKSKKTDNYYYCFSLLLNYYIRNKKTFSSFK
tara:strand:+ start:4217 stop:5218 length:1002 start_codon:yes stop_codon:yes gene_type:complete